jgi:Rps23 Pro-64 3,4-dihydroxylase Tpa1-like proline 4-hydroxylase
MATLTRAEIAEQVLVRLRSEAARLKDEFETRGRLRTFVVDDLLPADMAELIYRSFPPGDQMQLRSSLRERKYVSAQMDDHDPVLEEAVYAFQQTEVVEEIRQITGFVELVPDSRLYNGGISVMGDGHFLNPHLDNSHDKGRSNYRALNLLYYVTPGWQESYGGSLQLWDQGPKCEPRSLPASFNRLIVMATSTKSWHSVSEVQHDGFRCCVSNYYFAPYATDHEGRVVDDDYYHVTTFRGFPKQKVRDAVLVADGLARNLVRRVKASGIVDQSHGYKKADAGG